MHGPIRFLPETPAGREIVMDSRSLESVRPGDAVGKVKIKTLPTGIPDGPTRIVVSHEDTTRRRLAEDAVIELSRQLELAYATS